MDDLGTDEPPIRIHLLLHPHWVVAELQSTLLQEAPTLVLFSITVL